MQGCDRQSCSAIGANDANYAARIERLGRLMTQFAQVEKSELWVDIRAALTNQELALAVT